MSIHPTGRSTSAVSILSAGVRTGAYSSYELGVSGNRNALATSIARLTVGFEFNSAGFNDELGAFWLVEEWIVRGNGVPVVRRGRRILEAQHNTGNKRSNNLLPCH
jgi:hypothetical protein